MKNDNSVPIGTITMYGGSVDNNSRQDLLEQGWLICDGEDLVTTDYPDLFASIQFAFGKKGNRFHLPDCRGMFIRGVDHGRGKDPDASERTEQIGGGNIGDKVGSIQVDSTKEHKHEMATVAERANSKKEPLEKFLMARDTGTPYKTIINEGSKETRPINLYLNFIIKYAHITES